MVELMSHASKSGHGGSKTGGEGKYWENLEGSRSGSGDKVIEFVQYK
jgi:hypothetical protein